MENQTDSLAFNSLVSPKWRESSHRFDHGFAARTPQPDDHASMDMNTYPILLLNTINTEKNINYDSLYCLKVWDI